MSFLATRVAAVLVLEMALSCSGHAQGSQGSVASLEVLPNSIAAGTSVDGRVVAGSAWSLGDNRSGISAAFRWTGAGGIVPLGRLNGGSSSNAYGVSSDGSVIVGDAQDGAAGNAYRAFRWTQATGMVSLGVLNGGSDSRARATSGDGSVVVGSAADGSAFNAYRAYRWSAAGGMVSLGVLSGADTSSFANAVNIDGTAIAGVSVRTHPILDTGTAFRWTQAGGMASLGQINGGAYSEARGISADGNVVVGFGADGSAPGAPGPGGREHRAFRWTPATGMVSLGTVPGGNWSQAYGVSGDGQVVVGTASDAKLSRRAFRWTQSGGMQTVDDWLRSGGVRLLNDITSAAWAANRDGSVVVGELSTQEGFVARASGLIVPDTFNPTMVNAATVTTNAGIGLSSLALSGSHHRPLMDNGLVRSERGTCGWLVADAGSASRSDGKQQLTEGGICRDLDGGRWRVGFGLGKASGDRSLEIGGSARLRGSYAVGEADYGPDGRWIASATLLIGDFDTTIQRGYLNAGVPDASTGRPNAKVWALRGRLDWIDAFSIGTLNLGPHGSLTHYATTLAGYSENGGGFPAQFEARRQTSNELRLGVTGRVPVSGRTHVRMTAEAVRQIDGSASGIDGQVINLYAFSFPGMRSRGSWGRIGAEIDHRIQRASVLSAGINLGSGGAGSSISAGVTWKAAF